MLCSRGAPKLAVGGVCTSVAVDLGDLEGRAPELFAHWEEQERVLMEMVDWHTFKHTSEQVSGRGISLSAGGVVFSAGEGGGCEICGGMRWL